MTKPKREGQPEHRDNDGLHKRRGIWYYCLNIDGQRRFFSTKTRKWNEARAIRANATKAKLENRLPTDAAKQRFETLLAQVLNDRKPHLAENTVRLERERSGPLLKYFSGRRVAEIDAASIRAYQTCRARAVGRGLSIFNAKCCATSSKPRRFGARSQMTINRCARIAAVPAAR